MRPLLARKRGPGGVWGRSPPIHTTPRLEVWGRRGTLLTSMPGDLGTSVTPCPEIWVPNPHAQRFGDTKGHC